MGKYVFILGGCYSGSGKGCSAASIGFLLKSRGYSVNLLKCDGYINTTSSVIAPGEHGETWVTNDGKECDLDVGHYERICGITTDQNTIFTSGLLYKEVIEEHENGVYLGQTIQLQHITNKAKERIEASGKSFDVTIVEVGGVIGDVEATTFLEAVRYFQQKHREDVLVVVVAPVIWVSTIKEFKTKPLQNSIKELLKSGIQPDVLLCRADRNIPEQILDKISNLTNINCSCIFSAIDVQTIYQIPIEFYNNNLDDLIVGMLRLPRSACRISKYKEVVEKLINNDFPTIDIGIVYKYDNVDESYLSIKESLLHASVANNVRVNIQWIKAEELEKYKGGRGLHKFFENINGIIVPGGFGNRAIEGKIKAIQYAREKKIPFLGICLGLQMQVVEFARNVLNLEKANSLEFDKDTPYPVIHFVEGQAELVKKSANMRLGSYDCEVYKDTLAFQLYQNKLIKERHRHRYEVNPDYIDKYSKHGFIVSGRNPGTGLIEIMELKDHPFFFGVQFHPEFKSLLTAPSPVFSGLIIATIKHRGLELKDK